MLKQLEDQGITPNTSRLALGLALVVLFCLGAIGCSEPRIVEIDDHFSLNVARVPYWFPDEDQDLSPAEQEVILRRGVPQYIRFWWRPSGDLICTSDLTSKGPEGVQTDLENMRRTWIYYDRDEEIFFTREGASYEVKPIEPLIKLVCEYGDPGIRNVLPADRYGQRRENWTWIDHGLKIEFIDGVEVKRDHFTKTGTGTWLGK